jgi:hypothetical protein
MKTLYSVFLALVVAASALANWYSTEDESRFRSQPYAKAEPGMLTPAAYIDRATKALRTRYNDIRLAAYDTPRVTRRHYADAPAADRDVICVEFPYKELIKPPLPAAKRLPAPEFMARPVLLVLIRKDLSKIYVNEVYYQLW